MTVVVVALEFIDGDTVVLLIAGRGAGVVTPGITGMPPDEDAEGDPIGPSEESVYDVYAVGFVATATAGRPD